MGCDQNLYSRSFIRQLFILGVSLLLCIGCKKDSAECHYSLKIRNNSKYTITYAVADTYHSRCFVTTKSTLRPGEIYEDKRSECWEESLKNNDFEFYFLTPSLEPMGTSALCDSSSANANVRAKYRLTAGDLDFLERTDFLFTYTEL
jgi:hypothetical protein